MISRATFTRLTTAAGRAAPFLLLVAIVGLMLYAFPPQAITAAYAVASLLTAALLVCMLQASMANSSIWFRLAIAALAAGSLASSMLPFTEGYDLGPWSLMKALALLAVVAMMRHRQIKDSRQNGCTGSAYAAE